MEQMSFAYWHRGWKRQAFGGESRLGGLPGIETSRRRSPTTLGNAESNPSVYG